jgi:wobble nucleotide-excising tRNase
MINYLHLLRNIGLFDSVAAANIHLNHYTLVFAENGRGKTTLTAILRSLATGDPLHISERRRLATRNPPHVVLECSGGPPNAIFQNGAWNRTLPDLVIFDDRFVDENVHSGLAVDPEHRQNLHELILGAQGVNLNRDVQDAVDQITRDNANIRTTGDAVPTAERYGLSLDQFCALLAVANVDAVITTAEQSLRSARQATAIQHAGPFTELTLPLFDTAALDAILIQSIDTLDAKAVERVHQHCDALGERGERWVSEGIQMLRERTSQADCPFCEQPLNRSPRIDDFRLYFSDEYTQLKDAISGAITGVEDAHGGEVPTAFERSVRAAQDNQRFWADFTNVEPITVDSAQITRDWAAAKDEVLQVLNLKRGAPLERITLSPEAIATVESFNAHGATIAQVNQRLGAANQAIREVKRAAATANVQNLENELNRMKAARARHLAPTAQLCDAYLQAKAAKALTEERRERAKEALRQYRDNVFPQYQDSINRYLRLFNTGFQISQVRGRDTASGPTCTYGILIENETVAIAGGNVRPGEPSFRSTLSSGDRNSLALAFFFASLDHDPAIATRTVIIDDPVSSLDDHRSLTTVQQMRRLGERVDQLIVLSHNRSLLCQLYADIDSTLCTTISILRAASGSTFASWDVSADCVTQHDARHEVFQLYSLNGPHNLDSREVAQSIRPHLEAFLRVSYPDTFPPGMMLGPFRNVCEQRVGRQNQILSQHYIDELHDLTEYSNRYHHTNPAWATEVVNDTQLRGYIGRLMAFMQR